MGSYGAHGITWGFARFSLDFGYEIYITAD